MIVEAQITINASRAAIWAAITDIESASEIISGIEKIEVVDKPANGLVGLRWRETRMLFGKPATVEKWITDAAENAFYRTKAEDGGFVFLTTMRISEGSDGSMTLTSSHDSQPQGIVARLMSIPMRLFFKGMIKKAIVQDLNDIKSAVEQKRSTAVQQRHAERSAPGDVAMDDAKCEALKAELSAQPEPQVVPIARFFDGNDDPDSIGCNLDPHPGIDRFRSVLTGLLARPDVKAVYAQISELDPGEGCWPFSDTIFVAGTVAEDALRQAVGVLQPDEVVAADQSGNSPSIAERYNSPVMVVWWD